ncbi:MAG: 2-oxo acid dehydrogenase subunit E2 [Treponema sp.]|nr:2-oxo acid dehydrogenase subunit E2 [Treponema sp.]
MFTKKRPDGTYLRNIHFFTQIMPYLMPTRTESAIYFEKEFDVTNTLVYLRKKRHTQERLRISLFYLFLYSAMRVIAQRPKMNRFVSGYRYYQRNRISFNFIAKRELTDEGEEINVTMSFSPLLTLEGFCKKIDDYITSLKKGSSTDAEKLNSLVAHLPRFLIKLFAWGVKFLDYHNALPMSVIDFFPFFSTVFFTNVGSVGIDAPFHHNFEIGNCGIFSAFGIVRKENHLKSDGTVEKRDKVKITFTFDDRITDGIYCARAVDMVQDLVENPEKLELPLELTPQQLSDLGLAEAELAAADVYELP